MVEDTEALTDWFVGGIVETLTLEVLKKKHSSDMVYKPRILL